MSVGEVDAAWNEIGSTEEGSTAFLVGSMLLLDRDDKVAERVSTDI